MGEFSELFKKKNNLITLLILGILILAVPIGINLIKNQQIFKSRAAGEPIVIKETLGVFQRTKPGGGLEWVAKNNAKISIELTSPLGPPASAEGTVR
ncbi:MAG: hypothetical protein NUV73_04230 [Candidatus Daviesbacteria bacterium]|nr:hypothetical protein [Candidatus Daviesbacteria bacterium]